MKELNGKNTKATMDFLTESGWDHTDTMGKEEWFVSYGANYAAVVTDNNGMANIVVERNK